MRHFILSLALSLFATGSAWAQTLKSPDGNLVLDFHLSGTETPVYSLDYKGKPIIKESKMGFVLHPDYQFNQDFEIVTIRGLGYKAVKKQ